MTRCNLCKTPEFVDRLEKMCEKTPHTYSEIRRIAEYYDEHRDMTPLSGRALIPLMREKDPEIQAKALDAVGKNISHGNVPTARQVKQILENKRGGVKPKGRKQNDLGGKPTPEEIKTFLENERVKEQTEAEKINEEKREQLDAWKVLIKNLKRDFQDAVIVGLYPKYLNSAIETALNQAFPERKERIKKQRAAREEQQKTGEESK